jgi:short-subunit dehydrogenase
MRLQNARIILTGAASGIGAALVARLAGIPCAVVAADCDAPCLAETLARLPTTPAAVVPFVGDMGKREDVDALFDAAVERMGGVDLFIAAAGFAYYERLVRPDWEHIEAIFRVNAVSPIYCVEKMAELNGDRPHRTVIVASAMSRLAIPGYALYSGSKAALHRFTEAYRLEVPDRAAVSLVYPIGTRTRFFTNSNGHAPAPLPWPTQSAERVADAILSGIERDARAIYPSFLFRLTLAVDRVLPFTRRIEQKIEGRRFRNWLTQ